MQAKAIVLCLLYKNHQRRFQYLLYNFPDTRHPSYGICSRGKPSHLSWFPQLGEYLAFFIPIKGKRNKQILQGRVPQIWFRKGDRNRLNQDRWDLQGAFGQGRVPWAPWTTLSTSSHSKRAQRRHEPCSPGRDLVQQHNTTTPAQPQYHQHFPQGAVGNMTCGSGEMGPPELVFMKQKFFCVIQHRKIQVFSTKLCIISECWTILKWKTREVKQRTN